MNIFNLNSTTQLSQLLFGGVIKEKVKEPVLDEQGNIVLIKSGQNKGQIKTQIIEKEKKIKGLGLKPDRTWKTKKEGIYQTNEEVLNQLSLKLDLQHPAKKIADLILQDRGLKKDISIYYDGLEDKLYTDGMVRPSINHTGTATGRTSCNTPNLQNIPKGED